MSPSAGHAPHRSSASPPGPPVDPGGGDLFDYGLARHWMGFVLRAAWRHKLVAFACFATVVGLTVGALLVLPQTYRVQAIILALRNPVMSTLSNPNLFRPYEQDAPTRAARETVLRRDNLVALINETDLLRKEQLTLAPAYRWLEALFRLARGRERTHDEQVDALVDLLEKRLTVEVAEGTVTIALEWDNKETGFELVERAMQNFLQTRHTTEIAIVTDAITILEGYARSLQGQIDEQMEQVHGLERALKRSRGSPARTRVAFLRPKGKTAGDVEYAAIQSQLTAKRRAILDLEEFRARRLVELQTQLLQYQATYAEGHPAVQTTRQHIEALSGPSPQLDKLRGEAQELERELIRHAASTSDSAAAIAAAAAAAREERSEALAAAAEPESDDPKLAQERSHLRMLFQNYSNVLERIGAARLELDASQAAFKYRYSVVSPPQMPKRAIRPKRLQVLGAATVAGLMFALFTVTLLDVRSRRILERWQIERHLDVPVVAEVDR